MKLRLIPGLPGKLVCEWIEKTGHLDDGNNRALARVASAEHQETFLELAQKLSSDALARELRNHQRGEPPREDHGRGVRPNKMPVKVDLDPMDFELWQRARRYLAKEAGHELTEQEVLSLL